MVLDFFKVMAVLTVLCASNLGWGKGSLTPEEFEAQALRHNLDLRLEDAELRQAKAEASGIRVPAPQVGISQMEMKGGETAQGWQVSQAIPFPTKVSSDYKARQYALDAEKSALESKTQEIRAMANYIYFFVWESQEQERILQEKADLLRRHLSVARSIARSDTFAKIHLLKVESELDQLKNELEMLSQVQKERMTIAAQFLDKDPESFIFTALDPGLSETPNLGALDEVPQIVSAKKQVRRFEALETTKKSEWFPDFNITYSHMDQTAMFPENNQIMLGISLPFVYFWQPNSFSNQASAEKLSAEIELQKTRRSIQADKVNLEKAIDSLKKQIAVLTENILPRTLKRKNLFRNIAPRDLSSLQEHLDTYLSVPNVQLQILSLKSKYEQAVAGLARYRSAGDKTDD